MKLSDLHAALSAPFPSHDLMWMPLSFSQDGLTARVTPVVPVGVIQARLDKLCPDDWAWRVQPLPDVNPRAVVGELTILKVTRQDVGDGVSMIAASEDALRRCAVHFGIGRYLASVPVVWAEWDAEQGRPKVPPMLPDWARPDLERSPGGSHVVQAMQQLHDELPTDLEKQREVYKYLKAALGALHTPVASEEGED